MSHSISWTYNNKHLIPSSHHHLHLLNLPLLLFTIIRCTYLLHIGKPVSNLAITSMAVATPTIELKEMTNLKTELMNISKQKGRFLVSLLYAYIGWIVVVMTCVECSWVTSCDCCYASDHHRYHDHHIIIINNNNNKIIKRHGNDREERVGR